MKMAVVIIIASVAIAGAYMLGEEHGKNLMEEKINATLIIDFGNYSWNYTMKINKGINAYDFLMEAADEYNFSVVATYYSSFHSHFINSINGIKGGNGRYWQYWINGEYASVGADAYIVQDGDVIEWRLTTYEGK